MIKYLSDLCLSAVNRSGIASDVTLREGSLGGGDDPLEPDPVVL